MTTKKHSLLDRKVLKDDLNDPMALLHPKNINKEMLLEYIRDACDYCTDYQLPHLDFALNHHGEPDVALFDFTSMFAAGFASHVYEKNQRQQLWAAVELSPIKIMEEREAILKDNAVLQRFRHQSYR